MKRSLSIILVLILLTFTCCGNKKNATDIFSDDSLTVYFFDVGQADCSLLLFPGGTTVLIDAGNVADGPKIADFIDDLGLKTIDYFVLTHPHEDHIGGAVHIFDEFKISTVCVPDILEEHLPSTKVYESLVSAIKDEKCRELRLTGGTLIVEKENFKIMAIAPYKDALYSDMNNWSLCLSVDCFTNTLLFAGDAEEPSELDMLNSDLMLDADILKVGHHGNRDSSTKEFLKAVTPLATIISVGEGNIYDHPADETLKRLTDIGANIYRTDTVGTIIAKCYDGGFNIETNNKIMLDGNR